MAEEKAAGEGEKKDTAADVAGKKKSRGFLSRLWSGIFGVRGDDFEKRLQHISKEEAAVIARLKRRSLTWRRMARNLIVSSVIFEVVAVCYAIITTRAVDLNWKMRAFRVLPMFLLPALTALAYTTFLSFTRMCDRKDQKTLERLRAERQAKIDELKEKTNYYITQQLIQRYDPDPAAKAAAATVLASKLGADSGMKVHLGDEPNVNVPSGKSNDVEYVQPGVGLRNRKQGQNRSSSAGKASLHHPEEETHLPTVSESPHAPENNQLVVDHYNPQGPAVNDGGWLARIAALLVGEDPTQSYALICGNCHMHNGLVKKEDFPFITYYCPHCHALNRSNQSEEPASSHGTPGPDSARAGDSSDPSNTAGSVIDSVLTSNVLAEAISEVQDTVKATEAENLVSEGEKLPGLVL
ncbi:uncharacterized protein At2g24330 isoform X2 [Momordica charantia]|uniref:Uncharacterized protein At2g24330 isoform X2 n=1 Tax=Momordica charantia TaxID=3673 RepID=A0A6J1C1N4_MOMCH|nr:uncharacterized protein At2g24330 isoform X2 [Momordica charantia]